MILLQLILCLFFTPILAFGTEVTDHPQSCANNKLKESDPNVLVDQLLNDCITILTQKFKLVPCGTGMNGKYKYLELSFETTEELDEEAAREQLYHCAEIFLEKINSNQPIQPYLKSKPFGYENIGIVFYINGPERSERYHPKIAVARWSSHGVSFKTIDKGNKYGFKKVIHESHEEALSKIAQAKKIVSSSSS